MIKNGMTLWIKLGCHSGFEYDEIRNYLRQSKAKRPEDDELILRRHVQTMDQIVCHYENQHLSDDIQSHHDLPSKQLRNRSTDKELKR